MQEGAIQTAQRKFVPQLAGRLKATRADCTNLSREDGSADFVVVCETHVTEMPGQITEEDQKFFRTAHRLLKSGGMLVWGNAIPDGTWLPCFEFLESLGMTMVDSCDVTDEAIAARGQDKDRADDYVDKVLKRMWGFRIPRFGTKKRVEARQAMLNFYRNPGHAPLRPHGRARGHVQSRLLQEAIARARRDRRRLSQPRAYGSPRRCGNPRRRPGRATPRRAGVDAGVPRC